MIKIDIKLNGTRSKLRTQKKLTKEVGNNKYIQPVTQK